MARSDLDSIEVVLECVEEKWKLERGGIWMILKDLDTYSLSKGCSPAPIGGDAQLTHLA